MKNYIRLGASLVLLALLAVTSGASQESQELQKQQPAQPTAAEQAAIQKILQTLNPQQCLALVEGFLAQYPESLLRGRAYAAAAEAYRMQNNYDKAVEYGEWAIEINPRDAISMILIADSLSESARPAQADYEERLTQAEDYARRALGILPDLFAVAQAQRRPDVPEEQYKLQEQYIEAQPHATLGFIYLHRRQYEQAEAELKQATTLSQWRPNPADFERLGMAHMRRKEYAEAEAAFQRCVEATGQPQIGMTEHQVRRLWGKPGRVTQTVYEGLTTDHWCYGEACERAVYFHDGKVKAVQVSGKTAALSTPANCQKRLEHVQAIMKEQQTPKEDNPQE